MTPQLPAQLPVVAVHVPRSMEVQTGSKAEIGIALEPMLWSSGVISSGGHYTSLVPWTDHTVAEMRFCIAAEPCVPEGEWHRYEPDWTELVLADWLGPRVLWVGSEFRDTSGRSVPVPDAQEPGRLLDRGSTTITLNSILDTRTPLASHPPALQTAVASTRTAFPVTGSVELQNGMCCAGGTVGSTVTISADLYAYSPRAEVTEMRVLQGTSGNCATLQEMSSVSWEPFQVRRAMTYEITVPNWVGWFISVQYRDAGGNVSEVYCDDISIEGMP
jgi:hypothetical protein